MFNIFKKHTPEPPSAFFAYMAVVRRHNEAIVARDFEVLVGLIDAALAIIEDVRDRYGDSYVVSLTSAADEVVRSSPTYDGGKLSGGLYHIKK